MSIPSLRELRNAVLTALQSEQSCAMHNIPDTNIVAGKSDGNVELPTPSILVYVWTAELKKSESLFKLRTAIVTVFCIVEPKPDKAESEMDALELTEMVESILLNAKGFAWEESDMPEIDGSYPGYACASMNFIHPYVSSAP